MDSVPWWGSGLFTIGGALFGALATLSVSLLNRRTERRRLARAEKVAAYPAFVAVVTRLADLAVWPAEDDPREVRLEVERLGVHIAFFGPARVSAALGPVIAAARELTDVIVRIRADSAPGHGNRIDQRLAPQHHAAADALRQAVTAFATAARADLEIPSPYTPVAEGDRLATMSSREPGAGSREPGAGSREPGLG